MFPCTKAASRTWTGQRLGAGGSESYRFLGGGALRTGCSARLCCVAQGGTCLSPTRFREHPLAQCQPLCPRDKVRPPPTVPRVLLPSLSPAVSRDQDGQGSVRKLWTRQQGEKPLHTGTCGWGLWEGFHTSRGGGGPWQQSRAKISQPKTWWRTLTFCFTAPSATPYEDEDGFQL